MKVLNVAETSKGGISAYFDEISRSRYIDNQFLAYGYLKSFSLKPRVGRIKRCFSLLFSMLNLNDIGDYKIIFLHSTFAGILRLILYPIIKMRGQKLVYCSHGWSFDMEGIGYFKENLYRFIEVFLSKFCDQVYCISEADYRSAIGAGISPEKLTLVWNGVGPSAIDDRRNEERDEVSMLFVGRLDRQKGLGILFDALQMVDRSIENKVIFNVVGEPVLGDIENLSEMKEKRFENISVQWLGWVDRNHIDAYYQAADFVIVPSLWEGFGLVVAESLRNGTPVVCSNRGSLPDMVTDNVGWVVDIDTSDQLSSLIEAIVNKKMYVEKDKHACVDLYCERYSSEKMNFNYFESFKKLVAL